MLNLLCKLSCIICHFIGAKIRQLRRFDRQFFLLFTNLFDEFHAVSQRVYLLLFSFECSLNTFQDRCQWYALLLPVFEENPI